MITIDEVLECQNSVIKKKYRIQAICMLETLNEPQFRLIKRAYRIQLPNLYRIAEDDASVLGDVCINNLLETIGEDVQA